MSILYVFNTFYLFLLYCKPQLHDDTMGGLMALAISSRKPKLFC